MPRTSVLVGDRARGLAGLRRRTPGRSARSAFALAAALTAALSASTPATAATTATAGPAAPVTLTVRARGTAAGGVGPMLEVHLDGQLVARKEIRQTAFANHTFALPALRDGARLDIVYTNDGSADGQDRNLHVAWVRARGRTVFSQEPGVVLDRGSGSQAFDGLDVRPGQPDLWWNAALRFVWPSAADTAPASDPAGWQASRFLQQASFGPTAAEIDRVRRIGAAAWIDQQVARPYRAVYVPAVQAKFDLGADWRPGGANYSPRWLTETFWRTAATSPDQLRHRVAWALQQIFVVSLQDAGLWDHARPMARYLDLLALHALGNYRDLLQAVATSPAMGLYLSHMHNRRADPATGRMPDENFARELMQLFSIGLVELNPDGTPRLGDDGRPVETYGNADVMALARVFTGWTWGFDETTLSERDFLQRQPDYASTGSARVDLRAMRSFAAFHAPEAKPLFAGKPWALTIPAGTPAPRSLKLALDALFQHPNVGPFVGRQLIQHLVTSNPSPAYVARVARVFADNGRGVRGDLAAVVRAILLDPEARSATGSEVGKLREPVLRVAHWMRAFGATSSTGQWKMSWDLHEVGQRPQDAPSVFGYYRPGYVPPGTPMAARGATAPEFQIADESSVAAWVNIAEALTTRGIGWTGSTTDVRASYAAEAALAAESPQRLVDHLNLVLFAGRMSGALRLHLLDAMYGVGASTPGRDLERARLAILLALASPEYLIQR